MPGDPFDTCLAFTLKYEGGFVDDPRDPGGATKYGITVATLHDWRKQPVTAKDVRALSETEAAAIYRANYWDKMHCQTLESGVNQTVFDAGVNSGTARALAWKAECSEKGISAPELIKRINAKRLSFVEGLKTFPVFGRGWRARIAACEAASLTMAYGASASHPLETEARIAAEKSNSAKAVAKTIPLTGGSVEAAHQTLAGAHLWLTIFLGLAVAAGAAVFIVKYLIQQERAKAFSLAAHSVVAEPSPAAAVSQNTSKLPTGDINV